MLSALAVSVPEVVVVSGVAVVVLLRPMLAYLRVFVLCFLCTVIFSSSYSSSSSSWSAGSSESLEASKVVAFVGRVRSKYL